MRGLVIAMSDLFQVASGLVRSFWKLGRSRRFSPNHQLVLGPLELSFDNRGSVQVSLDRLCATGSWCCRF
jgi:hypothetical protein